LCPTNVFSFVKAIKSKKKFRHINYASIRLSLSLYVFALGFVLNLYEQHGHQTPSHFMYTLHTWQRFCPEAYLDPDKGFEAFILSQKPLHAKLVFLLYCLSYVIEIIIYNIRDQFLCWYLIEHFHKCCILFHMLSRVILIFIVL